MSDIKYLTPLGYKKLKDDLDFLVNEERARVLQKIAEARSHGDLSENAEYDAAKEEQSQLEIRISNLQTVLSAAKIIEAGSVKTDKVYILTKVALEDVKTKEKVNYQLVSSEEADLEQGKISVQSPIGKSLLGKSLGDKVDVVTPGGGKTFQILSISSK
ncbi:hypothetical protein CHS0354_024038 [Potamilus streckersoni]|uniref:Transcription elongation factor GreA n=1 Tax=Potamilus streckersoni TaxID=2493646 RepID=A0AAE0RZJ0_9BIVA|nr:hypothetical protein CHS0354_024038 [Potamilus streckersoni]